MSIRSVMALVVLIAAVLAVGHWWNDPLVRFRRKHDEASLRAVLSHRVANGDSIEAVEAVLGRGVVSTDPRMYQTASALASSDPPNWPQGVLADDEFRRYPIRAGMDQVLQYRGGRLVNLNRDGYTGLILHYGGTSR